MKRIRIFCAVMILMMMTTMTAMATTDEIGVVEYRPRRTAGVWVIDGQAFYSTASTQIQNSAGAVAVRRCVQVDSYLRRGWRFINTIESIPQRKCELNAAHNGQNTNTNHRDRNGYQGEDDSRNSGDSNVNDYEVYDSDDDDDYAEDDNDD